MTSCLLPATGLIVLFGAVAAASTHLEFVKGESHSSCALTSFEDQFERAKRIVEGHLQCRLDVRLELSSNWNDKASLTSGFSEYAAFMRRTDRKVLLNPSRFEALVRSQLKSTRDIDHLALMLFVHELLHSYQADVLRNHKTQIPARWVRFFCEGHAVVFVEEIACKLRISEDVLIALKPSSKVTYTSVPEKDRAVVREQFYYVTSARFVRERAIKINEFEKLLKADLTVPEALLCKPRNSKASNQPVLRLKSLASSSQWKQDRPVTELDFFEAALMLCPPAFDNRNLCEAYDGGAFVNFRLPDDSFAEVLLLQFQAEQNAAFAKTMKEYALSQKGLDERSCHQARKDSFKLLNFPERRQILYAQIRDELAAFVVMKERVEEKVSQAMFAHIFKE
jgi:hypothetical protein